MITLPQGIQSANFYDLINFALLQKGYNSIADFIREAPNYWFDDEAWKELFPMAPYENAERTFMQKIGDTYTPVMATYLAEDAETPLISNEGFEMRTNEIPRMGQGFLFNSKSYDDARKLNRVGVEAVVSSAYDAFSLDVMKLLRGIHSQRTFTSLQIESKGSYITTKQNNNGGIQGFKIDMNPLAANRKGAGGFGTKGVKAVYTDPNANPIGDLQDMFEYGWRNRIISADPSRSVFRMADATWETIKNHPNTRKAVAMWKVGYLVSAENLAGVNVTDADLKAYLSSLNLPAVSISKTYGFYEKVNKDTQKIEKASMSAFEENTVVLRPAGAMGQMQWARVSNLFATADVPMYYTDGGAIAIQEDKNARAKGIKFSAETLCVPVPTAIERVLYLNTAEAAK